MIISADFWERIKNGWKRNDEEECESKQGVQGKTGTGIAKG